MNPEVGLQMRQFVIRLVTARLGADEGLLSVRLRSFIASLDVTRLGGGRGEADAGHTRRRTLIEDK